MYAKDGMRDIFSQILSKLMEVLSISHSKLSLSFSLASSMSMANDIAVCHSSANTERPNEIARVICLLLFMDLLENIL